MKNKPYPCAACGHYTRSHANENGSACWCDCQNFREPDMRTRILFLLDAFTEEALDRESEALDAESRRASTAGWQRQLADEAWRAANLLRNAIYACETCGHSTEPLGPGSDGDHSEDDGSCFTCGPELGKRCARDEGDGAAGQTVLCRIQCPDCGEVVPVGVMPGEVDENGDLVIEPDLTDAWAHRFTHDPGGES